MALAKKYRERLEMAASELEAWKPTKAQRFNMRTWGRKTDCGTACCAAGYLSLRPWFRRRGLVGTPVETDDFEYGVIRSRTYGGGFSECAVADFFGLDECSPEFSRIFYAFSVRKPAEIARRIRAFLKADANAVA